MSTHLVNEAVQIIRNKPTSIEKHVYLAQLQQCNPPLYYGVLVNNVEEMLPLVYTPVVGYACQNFHNLFFNDKRAVTVSIRSVGQIRNQLRTLRNQNVKAIVVSDGERILGLGDLGVSGAGIPIGKLALYTACAGVPPQNCLPVILDVGTNNKKFLADPTYPGLRQERVTGQAYDDFLEEFMTAAHDTWDNPLIQFEDFGNHTAFNLLTRYENRLCTFNDDIQGTASVVLAGIFSSIRLTGGKISDQVFLFLGAGEAGAGIAELLSAAISAETGASRAESRKHCYLIDSKGLVESKRTGLAHHKLPFAHEHAPAKGLLECITSIKPTALIGVAAQGGAFNAETLKLMASINKRPIIFALSNPTSKAECTAKDAYQHTAGAAIFASGSPFDPVPFGGKTLIPGQGNNSYIFPGVGLGVVFAQATRVPESVFLTAARAVADLVEQKDLDVSLVYPPLATIRSVSRYVAVATIKLLVSLNLVRNQSAIELVAKGDDALDEALKTFMYEPSQSQLSKL